MSQLTYVIGHKNPDTDSVVSAIVLSDYLKSKKVKAVACVGGNLNKESKFVLSLAKERYPRKISSASKKTFFLVDHGNLEESIEGMKADSICGVLDHHKMSGISTDMPIFYRCEPVGSTSTLIYKLFEESNIKLNKKQATLLLCAIISDTLKFNSSTTTKEDETIARKLSKLSGLKISELAEKMFKEKSDLSGMKPKEIILNDYKEYVFLKGKIGVGNHETTDISATEEIKEKLLNEMSKIKKEKKVDYLFFTVIDIINKDCYFYLESLKEKELIKKLFKGSTLEEKIIKVRGIVSRKKEIVPPLSKALN